jgi:hypothetical protein
MPDTRLETGYRRACWRCICLEDFSAIEAGINVLIVSNGLMAPKNGETKSKIERQKR